MRQLLAKRKVFANFPTTGRLARAEAAAFTSRLAAHIGCQRPFGRVASRRRTPTISQALGVLRQAHDMVQIQVLVQLQKCRKTEVRKCTF